jgi:hypothetical protein
MAATTEQWTGSGRPSAEWVLGACKCEPFYSHCVTCDGRRAVRDKWDRDHSSDRIDAAVAKERARIVDRLRARATSEQVTADRHLNEPDLRSAHELAASVLSEECDRLEKGL